MTFLEMCQSVASRTGITATGPTSVTGQQGILAEIVSWVQLANMDIQIKRDDWYFHWDSAASSLTPDRKIYLPGDVGASNLNVIRVFLVNGKEGCVLDWDEYVDLYRKTNQADNTATEPNAVTVSPDRQLHFYPVPTEAATIELDYSVAPTELVNNVDVSVIPVRFHQAVIERALMYYAEYEEDTYRYNQSMIKYMEWLKIMGRNNKPKVTFA